jgi:hypothetical protein
VCRLPSTVWLYYCNHIVNTNQNSQLNTQCHVYYTSAPHVYSHWHSGELAPNPTFITPSQAKPEMQTNTPPVPHNFILPETNQPVSKLKTLHQPITKHRMGYPITGNSTANSQLITWTTVCANDEICNSRSAVVNGSHPWCDYDKTNLRLHSIQATDNRCVDYWVQCSCTTVIT